MAFPQPFFISGDNEDDLQVCCNISEHRLWDNWGFCIGIVSGFPSSNFVHSFIFTYWMKHIYVKLDRHLHVFFKFPYQWHCSFWIAHRQQWAMLFIWKCFQRERQRETYKAGAASCRRIAALLLRWLNGRAENYDVLWSTLLFRLFHTTLWAHGLCVFFHNFGITSLILTKFL